MRLSLCVSEGGVAGNEGVCEGRGVGKEGACASLCVREGEGRAQYMVRAKVRV